MEAFAAAVFVAVAAAVLAGLAGVAGGDVFAGNTPPLLPTAMPDALLGAAALAGEAGVGVAAFVAVVFAGEPVAAAGRGGLAGG